MTTITRERIELFIKSPLENGITRSEQMELARIALLSLEAETVLYMNRFTRKAFTLDEQPGADKEPNIYVPLYTAPPAPVVPDEIDLQTCHLDGLTETYAEGWNACRTAMLQGGKL